MLKLIKQNLILLGIIFCNFPCYSQIDANSRAEMNLRGNIKSVTEYSYHAIDKFGKLTKGGFGRGWPPIWNEIDDYTLTFNTKGNKVTKITFDSQGVINDKSTFVYNQSDKLIEINSYEPNGILKSKEILKYDNVGNKIEETTYNGKGDQISKYAYIRNNQGKVTEETAYYGPGAVTKTFYKYDSQGNLIERYYEDGTYFKIQNVDGKMVEQIEYMDNRSIRKYRYKYDRFGNLTKYEKIYGEISTQEDYSCSYECDNNSNWIKETIYEFGKATYIIERQLVYF
jgi:hypothetical protein